MIEPRIFIIRDGIVPSFIVAIRDPSETDPPVYDLHAWAHTFGEAQEHVRDWKLQRDHDGARARAGAEW